MTTDRAASAPEGPETPAVPVLTTLAGADDAGVCDIDGNCA
ncbi:hypothetical protein [Nocardioides massiliensis]|uniref:FxLD family lantipeptide n=1 Tax=Nocardioides massiliensis TaxID=1325935 RepID=A0ABT9NPB0_9ACTN|nr:hypothetical protein [Nocardioides massiliensis]MDP9822136.1 hypothetical protein [Nocardioides massiliensis]